MKLSVIVPVYNVEKYLEKCLDSLVNQTISDYEIIVVNDGSPDNSQRIIDDYAARYPGLIIPMIKENGGQSSARNYAMSVAKGEFIAFVDSDDWVDPRMYEKLLELIERENADIAFCDMRDYNEDGSITEHDCTSFVNGDPLTVTCSACCKLFRRSAIGETRFPVGLWYEDLAFTTSLLFKTEKIAVLHETLYFCNNRAGSTMNNNNALKNLDMLTVLDGLREAARESGHEDKLDYLVLTHLLRTSINRVAEQDSPDKKAVIKQMREYVHDKIPKLTACPTYRAQPKKVRVVMFLNYHGMENVTKLLFRIRKGL